MEKEKPAELSSAGLDKILSLKNEFCCLRLQGAAIPRIIIGTV